MPDVGFGVFETYNAILLALGIFVLTYVVRAVVQYFWKNWRISRFYNEFVLHLLPIVMGGIVSISKTYPWPDIVAKSWSGRLFYGMVLGMFCGFIYSRFRKVLEAVPGIKASLFPKAGDVIDQTAVEEVMVPPASKVPEVSDEEKTPVEVPIVK